MGMGLVVCGLNGPDTIPVTTSDREVWQHHVERDEYGKPTPEQVAAWQSPLSAPPVQQVS
jgi:hypothetical protein